jgi:hypothetical protein
MRYFDAAPYEQAMMRALAERIDDAVEIREARGTALAFGAEG